MFKKTVALTMLLVSANAMANSLAGCKFPAGLTPGISMKFYQLCAKKINSCPKAGAFLNKDCVKKIMSTTAACTQLQKIADHVQVSPEMLKLKQYGSYKVLTLNFAADGGHSYYIVTPQGCFVNTNVDPRSLNAQLKQKYADFEFFTEANPPVYKKNGRFISVIEVKKTCRACEKIGNAKVLFDFSKNGTKLDASLIKFDAVN